MTIFAAGALCWREQDGALLVAIIHRSRYNDWSWPKGKVDPGETLPEAAVREIREETGLRIRLGVPLTVQHYKLENGADKEVHYWAAKVTDSALAKSDFKPDEEVSSVEWVTLEDARSRLTYAHDRECLEDLMALHRDDLLNTKPFIVLRHAKAASRVGWLRPEGKRPLVPEGFEQGAALIPLLGAFGPKRVVTSPWSRCRATVEPYARSKKLVLVERGQLTEFGTSDGPRRTTRVIEKLLEEGKAAVICSHRPALPTILDALSKLATPRQEILIHEARALEPASMLVLHLTTNEKGARRIAGIETHSPTAKVAK
jgi:8-oxo-dGTP diphosphatase